MNKWINLSKLFHFLLIVSLLGLFSACHSTRGNTDIETSSGLSKPQHAYRKKKGHGPPAHAPARGYRAKYTYHYYASAHVYFDLGRYLYFYQEGKNWRVSASLPAHLRTRLDLNYVRIEMDTDKPYTQHAKHKKNYPPGMIKKYKAAEENTHAQQNRIIKAARTHYGN
jgi:hypothetical protein